MEITVTGQKKKKLSLRKNTWQVSSFRYARFNENKIHLFTHCHESKLSYMFKKVGLMSPTQLKDKLSTEVNKTINVLQITLSNTKHNKNKPTLVILE